MAQSLIGREGTFFPLLVREYRCAMIVARELNCDGSLLLGRDAVWPFCEERGSLPLALVLSAVEQLIGAISHDSLCCEE